MLFFGDEARGIRLHRAAGWPGGLNSGVGGRFAQPIDGFACWDDGLLARLEVLYPRQQLSRLTAFELDGVRGFEFLGALELLVGLGGRQ